jgi:aldehyde dehydrogenase (NAD+)/betaine-aldehyde dehydrogenase|tara:strand:+ start:325 stop:465 length:141 start_codon:yes stop_codon:yes gene_type:complete
MEGLEIMKDSGYYKEADIESIKDYTRIKTTWFNISEKPMTYPFTIG